MFPLTLPHIYCLLLFITAGNSRATFDVGSSVSIPFEYITKISVGNTDVSNSKNSFFLEINDFNNDAYTTLDIPFATIDAVPNLCKITSKIEGWRQLKSEADVDAINCIISGRKTGRMFRSPSFDIYFPSKNRNGTQPVLLFIPGAGVDHSAYSTVADKMSRDHSIIVVVISLEPFRMAATELLEMGTILHAVKTVELLWNERCQSDDYNLDFSLGGHSYGAYASMRIAPSLASYLRGNSTKSLKLILWAFGSYPQYFTDLSSYENIESQVILGSNDGIVVFDNDDSWDLFRSILPPKSRIHYIKGGNHCNFASYNVPRPFIEMNGSPDISKELQQELAINHTVAFLLQKR
jgi:hypothetical protein